MRKQPFFYCEKLLEMKFNFMVPRVFGGDGEHSLTNDEMRSMEYEKIAPQPSYHTPNPLNPIRTTRLLDRNVTTPSIEHNRANWWTGLRNMWKTVGITRKLPRKTCLQLACMRRKRERSGITKFTCLTIEDHCDVINTTCTVGSRELSRLEETLEALNNFTMNV